MSYTATVLVSSLCTKYSYTMVSCSKTISYLYLVTAGNPRVETKLITHLRIAKHLFQGLHNKKFKLPSLLATKLIILSVFQSQQK